MGNRMIKTMSNATNLARKDLGRMASSSSSPLSPVSRHSAPAPSQTKMTSRCHQHHRHRPGSAWLCRFRFSVRVLRYSRLIRGFVVSSAAPMNSFFLACSSCHCCCCCWLGGGDWGRRRPVCRVLAPLGSRVPCRPFRAYSAHSLCSSHARVWSCSFCGQWSKCILSRFLVSSLKPITKFTIFLSHVVWSTIKRVTHLRKRSTAWPVVHFWSCSAVVSCTWCRLILSETVLLFFETFFFRRNTTYTLSLPFSLTGPIAWDTLSQF